MSDNICGVLNLTVRCNHDCEFCCDGDVKDSGHHLTTEEAKARIEELARQGSGSITFIGGEPTIRKDLTELVRHVKSLGMWTSLTTNGTLLGNGRLEELMEAGLSSLEISMHAADFARSREISRREFTPQRHRDLLDSLKAMPRDKRPGVAVNFVLYGKNVDQLVPMARLMVEEYPFINEFFVNYVDPIGFPAMQPDLVPQYAATREVLQEGIGIAVEGGLNTTMDNVPACIAGPYMFLIRTVRERARGVQYSKSTFRIKDTTPEDDTSQYMKINACRRCSVAAICPGVNFRYLKFQSPRGFSPVVLSNELVARLVFPKGSEETRLKGIMTGLLARQEEQASLKTGYLEVATQCNNRCEGCGHICDMGKTQAPSLEQLLQDMERIKSQGMTRLVLTGPEPTLRRDLTQVLQAAKERFPDVILETNARALAYPRLADSVAGSGVSEVRVTFHAGHPGEHDRLVRVKGAFDQTVKGLENLLRHKALHVSVRLVLHETAADTWTGTLEKLTSLGIAEARLIPAQGWDPRWTTGIRDMVEQSGMTCRD